MSVLPIGMGMRWDVDESDDMMMGGKWKTVVKNVDSLSSTACTGVWMGEEGIGIWWGGVLVGSGECASSKHSTNLPVRAEKWLPNIILNSGGAMSHKHFPGPTIKLHKPLWCPCYAGFPEFCQNQTQWDVGALASLHILSITCSIRKRKVHWEAIFGACYLVSPCYHVILVWRNKQYKKLHQQPASLKWGKQWWQATSPPNPWM